MKRLQKFPKKWKSVVHCTKHFDYSQSKCTDIWYEKSPFLEKSQWDGVDSLTSKKEFGLVIPHKIYKYNSELFAQLTKQGNWFVFSFPRVWADCSTCDGQTESCQRVCGQI